MRDLQFLKKKANQLRMDCIQAVHESPLKHGHLGGCLSIAEIIVALYYEFMRIDPQNPNWTDRDRCLLSKGHNCLIWYAALADLGYFPYEELKTYKDLGSILQGHPDACKCPGIDYTSGSLGQGLSIGIGMALDSVRVGRDNRVYVIMSDGEMQEGMVWEAVMAASHYKLDNLTCIVDRNNLQVNGLTEEIMKIEPLEYRFATFGWNSIRIDGNQMESVVAALDLAREHKSKPTVLICDTIKGKGVSFMENVMEWHAKNLTDAEYETAIEELRSGAGNK